MQESIDNDEFYWTTPLGQAINSYLMEIASETADELIHNDMKDNEIYKLVEEISYYTDEAQELFNKYYDIELNKLYAVIKNIKEIESRY